MKMGPKEEAMRAMREQKFDREVTPAEKKAVAQRAKKADLEAAIVATSENMKRKAPVTGKRPVKAKPAPRQKGRAKKRASASAAES